MSVKVGGVPSIFHPFSMVGWDSSLADQFQPGSCGICRLPEGVLPAEESDADAKEGGEDSCGHQMTQGNHGIPRRCFQALCPPCAVLKVLSQPLLAAITK